MGRNFMTRTTSVLLTIIKPCKYFYLRAIRRRKFCIVILFVQCTLALSAITLYWIYCTCSYAEVEVAVALICRKYKEKQALGNLCEELCESRSLQPKECLPHHLGKDVVFLAQWKKRKVVIKASKLKPELYDQIYWVDSNNHLTFPDVQSFLTMIEESVQRNLNISLQDRGIALINKLWQMNETILYHPFFQNIAMNNIWHLIQQSEYLLLKFYEEKNVFPKVLGTCGHMYVVEYIEPLDNFFVLVYPSWKKEFWRRAALSVQILKHLEVLGKLSFQTLHICDAKIGHFGFDVDHKIKLLDTDMLFVESVLIQNMVMIKGCNDDKDCSFIDCKGSCIRSSNSCEPKVLNNNLQRVCRNVFVGNFMQEYFGLLGSSPRNLSSELKKVLYQCINQDEKVSETEISENILQLLYSGLAVTNHHIK